MDNVTRAKINLFAVLRNIEDLCTMDPVSADLIKGVDLGVEFNVPEVGSAVLTFKDGKCKFTRGKGKSALKLYFTSPEHFNNLIAPPIDPKTGKPKMVIPIFYNVFKVGFLLNTFTKLADRLSHYLQPAPEEKEKLLQDPAYFEANTILTAYTAFYAMSEIANSDFTGKAIARRMPDGVIACAVGGTDGQGSPRHDDLRRSAVRARSSERQVLQLHRHGHGSVPDQRLRRDARADGKAAHPGQLLPRLT